MLQRLVHKADFERLLATRSRLRSAHFALHHVAGGPAPAKKPARLLLQGKLSTGAVGNPPEPVDNRPIGHWLGCVVPKRHARRSVTRSLIKRQMRSVFERHAGVLPTGLWLLRLSQGFAVADFVSANSLALTQAVRTELETLLRNQRQRVAQPAPVQPVDLTTEPGPGCSSNAQLTGPANAPPTPSSEPPAGGPTAC